MSAGGTYLRTGASTTFSGKGCSELTVGDAAGVAGVKQTDGTVLATTVYVNK